MANAIMLSNVRVSFPQLITPKASAPGGPEKYGADFLFDAGDQNHKAIMAAIQALALEKWKEKAPIIMQMINADRKMRCFGAGSERVSTKTLKPFDGYDGKMYVSALCSDQPNAFDETGNIIPPTNTMAVMNQLRRIYGGCYVNAAIKPWPQDNKHGRAIRCELIGFQFAGPGEPFGEGRPDVTGMFGQVADPAPAVAQAMPPGFPSFMSDDVPF